MGSMGPITASGTVTTYLPLTTAWPSYSGCASQLLNNDPGTTVTAVFGNDPKYANVVAGAPTCVPPAVSSWWYQKVASDGEQRPTSIALGGYDFSCPEFYQTVYSSTAADLLTTAIGCCPSGYNFHGPSTFPADNVNQCYTTFPAGLLTYAQFSAAGTYTISSTSVTAGSIAGVQINGYIFKNTAVPTGTTNSNVALTSNPTGGTFTLVSSLPASVGSSSGISSGAKTGIGIGVALVAVAALLGAAFLFRRKRRAAAENRVIPADLSNVYHDTENGGNIVNTHSTQTIQSEKKVALGPVELTAEEARRHEMDGGSNYDNLEHRAELA